MNLQTAWAAREEELAAITANRIIIDRHNWHSFRPLSERKRGLTNVKTGTITDWTLRRHFRGEAVEHLIAVPASAFIPSHRAIPTWGWLGFDIQTGAAGRAESWDVTVALAFELSQRRLSYLVEDYGGQGNYHIWIPLRRESDEDLDAGVGFPTREFAQQISGVVQSSLVTLALGFPLPGRHHTLESWSRFWADDNWLEGEEAVTHWLRMRPGPLPWPLATPALAIQDLTPPENLILNPPEPINVASPDVERASEIIAVEKVTGSPATGVVCNRGSLTGSQATILDADRSQFRPMWYPIGSEGGRNDPSYSWKALLPSTVLLLLAFLDIDYGPFYTILRIVVTFTAFAGFYLAWYLREDAWAWLLVALAVLYNPIVPVYFGDRGPWLILDLIAIALLWASSFVLHRAWRRKLPP